LLRHSSIETTTVYAKVDVNLLKEVVQPWPGAQPC
jgi:site-specific recombinase XerD